MPMITEIRLSPTEYEVLAEQAPIMIWRSGIDAECNYFNTTWLKFTGRTFQEECGDGWSRGVHPEDLERCLKTYREAFERRETFEMKYRLRRHDGQYRWIFDRGVPTRDARGDFSGYIGSCVDITEWSGHDTGRS
jgi:PAS domain S-box-containing protein